MAKQALEFFPVGYRNVCATFDAADGTTPKLLAAAGAEDSLVRQLTITNTGDQHAVLDLFLNDGTDDHLLMTLTLAPRVGSDGQSLPVDVLSAPFFASRMPIQAGWSIRAAAKATLSAAVVFHLVLADY